MKEQVTVIPSDQTIIIDGTALPCEFQSQTQGLHALQWRNGTGEMEIILDGNITNVPVTDYDSEVQPYVDIWQARYDELNTPHVPTLDEIKAAGLNELEAAFNTASQEAHCTSSAGFEIDADEIANRNIEGLVLVMQAGETTLFRAYDNSFHEVTREQLEIMRKEIVINSQYLYQAKWTIEAQIMQAQTAQAVADIGISADTIAALANTLKAQAMEAANGEVGAENAETA